MTNLHSICSLLQDDTFRVRDEFSLQQFEAVASFRPGMSSKSEWTSVDVSTEEHLVEYHCRFIQADVFDGSRPVVILPMRNNLPLARFTLGNLHRFGVDKQANILVVDDRSEVDLETLALDHSCSYLRIDTNGGFNFSMLVNVGAKVAHAQGCREIVTWNSDLWTSDSETFPKLVERHRASGAAVSGTKLLYPPDSFVAGAGFKIRDSPSLFGENRVQFGGAYVLQDVRQRDAIAPTTPYQFTSKDDKRVNCDKGDLFVHGAFQIINLDSFVRAGGFNPSLKQAYQDIDICLRANEAGESVMYFGRNVFLYHAESTTSKHCAPRSQVSDHLMFRKLWTVSRFLKLLSVRWV